MSAVKKLRLDRAVQLWASKNGVVVAAPRKARRNPAARGFLPFHSTDTMDEAERLMVHFCRLSRQDNETYFLSDFKQTIEDLERVGLVFEAFYIADKARQMEAAS